MIWLLPLFCLSLAALNWGRWDAWNLEGLTLYVTHPIMQTTLYDFAWVLAIATWLIHQDARRHGLRYWYIFPTFPVMPAIGLLIYLWIRHRTLAGRAARFHLTEVNHGHARELSRNEHDAPHRRHARAPDPLHHDGADRDTYDEPQSPRKAD